MTVYWGSRLKLHLQLQLLILILILILILNWIRIRIQIQTPIQAERIRLESLRTKHLKAKSLPAVQSRRRANSNLFRLFAFNSVVFSQFYPVYDSFDGHSKASATRKSCSGARKHDLRASIWMHLSAFGISFLSKISRQNWFTNCYGPQSRNFSLQQVN